MSVYIANTVPGDVQTPVKPTQPIYFGMKSDDGFVILATLNARMGFTNLAWKPSTDPKALNDRAPVTLSTPERRGPFFGEMTYQAGETGLEISSFGEQDNSGIFEVEYEIGDRNSLLAHIAVPVFPGAWQLSPSAYFCSADQLVNFYAGVELGTRNTGLFAFLRNSGTGEVVLGGPLQEFDGVRPGQKTVDVGWNQKPDGSVLHLYLIIDYELEQAELWFKYDAETSPTFADFIRFADLGNFPQLSGGFSNSRPSQSNKARLFFGNPGIVEETLTISDYALYPDFRRAAVEGMAHGAHTLLAVPDCPVQYRADKAVHPSSTSPGRWLVLGTAPGEEFYYQPGRRSTPLYSKLRRSGHSLSGFFKREIRIQQRVDGFVVEGFVGGKLLSQRTGASTGMGFSVDDGESLFEAIMLDTEARQTWALRTGDDPESIASYELPTADTDYRGLRFVRLAVDRLRNKAALYVDDLNTPIIERALTDTFPAGTSGKVSFGQIQDVDVDTEFDVGVLNYMPRYKAWEARDDALPSAGAGFTKMGTESTAMDVLAKELIFEKPAFGTSGQELYFTKGEGDFSEAGGFLFDFRAVIDEYTNAGGTKNQISQWTGVSSRIYIGTKLIELGFFDCGFHGKRVGIVPSGGMSEILDQTPTGKKYSALVDWTEPHTYRVVVRSYDTLDVYVDSLIDYPAISIPFSDLDLPLDNTPCSIRFGHFEPTFGGRSRWSFIRWGVSNGYEVALSQQFPDGLGDHLSSGRVLAIVEFGDSPFSEYSRPLSFGELSDLRYGTGFGNIPLGSYAVYRGGLLIEVRT